MTGANSAPRKQRVSVASDSSTCHSRPSRRVTTDPPLAARRTKCATTAGLTQARRSRTALPSSTRTVTGTKEAAGMPR